MIKTPNKNWWISPATTQEGETQMTDLRHAPQTNREKTRQTDVEDRY